MNNAFQRGTILIEQGRFDLADREFRQALAQDPDDPLAHAFLALCLTQRDRDGEALRESDEAIRLAPAAPFSHYVRGCALQALHRPADAEASAREAIQLDPANARYLALLAAIAMDRRDWKGALEAADRGLALDPEHPACLNLRAMALVQLGRKDEAAQTLGSALADDPENALTHANQGWALLHRGDHAAALEHFREALRLDPDLDWARAGVIESLKARFLIYRLMLGFFLWMGRQGVIAQWGVILGFLFGRQILADLADRMPALRPFLMPLLILSFGFLLMTWISSPLFNIALWFNKFGRMALSRQQKFESGVIGACFAIAAASVAAYFLRKTDPPFFSMVYFGFLLFPLAVTLRTPAGGPRRLMALYTLAVGLLGASALGMILSGIPPARKWGLMGNPVEMFKMFLYGSMFSTWLPSLLGRGLGR